MDTILFEMIAYYAPQIMQAVFYAVAVIIGITAGKYLKPLLKNKVVEILAKNAVQFVEQTCKDLHGDDKLNEALTALSAMLAKWKITITPAEMKIMLESAVCVMNQAFQKSGVKPAEATYRIDNNTPAAVDPQ